MVLYIVACSFLAHMMMHMAPASLQSIFSKCVFAIFDMNIALIKYPGNNAIPMITQTAYHAGTTFITSRIHTIEIATDIPSHSTASMLLTTNFMCPRINFYHLTP